MPNSILSAKVLQNEAAAVAWVEARVWPEGPVCPHCGGVERIGKMGGKATRIGLWKCYQCRKQFTVKVGTVFEDSHVPMNLWLQAMYLLCSSKKGISSNQLSRTLGVTLKTAWFMSHRIREALRVVGMTPMGGEGKTVEADDTFIGRIEGMPKGIRGGWPKNIVLTLVERGGSARSLHVDGYGARLDASGSREHREGNRREHGRGQSILRCQQRVCRTRCRQSRDPHRVEYGSRVFSQRVEISSVKDIPLDLRKGGNGSLPISLPLAELFALCLWILIVVVVLQLPLYRVAQGNRERIIAGPVCC
jgi:transposase-like protein